MKPILTGLAGGAVMLASPAAAQLSDPVRVMLEGAIESGNASEVDTVAKYAKTAFPEDADAIDAMVGGWKTKVAERKRAELESANLLDRWEGEGQLGFTRSTGTSSDIGLNSALRLKRVGLDWTHALRAQVDYQESNGVTTRERIMAALESQYRFDDNAFAFGQFQFDRDRVQGVEQRYAISGGLGWTVVEQPDLRIALKGGPAYRYTRYRRDGDEQVITGLGAVDSRWTVASGIALTEQAQALVATDNSTFTSTTALDANLIGSLSARLSYTLDYQTAPPPGLVDLSTLSRVSLVYGF